jgi:hypothetical protein
MNKPQDNTGANESSEVKEIMTPAHPQWNAFMTLLTGEEGCNFQKGKKGPRWLCAHGFEFTRAILSKHFPQVDIEESLKSFQSHGGYCDCEIVFNVEDSFKGHQDS